LHLVQNCGMQIIELPTVTIRQEGDAIRVEHKKSGMVTETTVRQLDRWGVAQLRKGLMPAPSITQPEASAA